MGLSLASIPTLVDQAEDCARGSFDVKAKISRHLHRTDSGNPRAEILAQRANLCRSMAGLRNNLEFQDCVEPGFHVSEKRGGGGVGG